MFAVVDPLVRHPQFRFVRNAPSCVGVTVKAREVAAGNLHPDLVAGPEYITGDSSVYADLVDLPLPREYRLIERIPVPQPQRAVGQILCEHRWATRLPTSP